MTDSTENTLQDTHRSCCSVLQILLMITDDGLDTGWYYTSLRNTWRWFCQQKLFYQRINVQITSDHLMYIKWTDLIVSDDLWLDNPFSAKVSWFSPWFLCQTCELFYFTAQFNPPSNLYSSSVWLLKSDSQWPPCQLILYLIWIYCCSSFTQSFLSCMNIN